MATEIILKIKDEDMERFQHHAQLENMSLAEFIEAAAIRYVDQNELIDEFELADILENENLLQ